MRYFRYPEEKKNGELRGCIGYIYGAKALREAVRDCTVEAATRDQRFASLQSGEEQAVNIEISVLTPPQKIDTIKAIEIGKHGLIISKGMHRGVLLPQVPVEWGWNRADFLNAVCQKAGLPDGAWKEGAELYVFTAQVFKEQAKVMQGGETYASGIFIATLLCLAFTAPCCCKNKCGDTGQ